MPYPYQIWDVFTDTPLEGNPLAVVFEADGMPTERCQAIAREFNLSETIFLTAGETARHGARIFTPAEEMPFAGHPTVGGSIAAALRAGNGAEVTLDLPAGPTVCRVTLDSDARGRSTITAPKIPHLEAGVPDNAILASALGLPEGAVGAGPLQPTRANSGPKWTVVPLANPAHLETIALLRGVVAEFGDYASTYVIAPTGPAAFRCRMFAPMSGIEEDPATGSAAVAFAAVWHAATSPDDGVHELSITQGVEMGRRSEISIAVTIAKSHIANVDLSGAAVLIATGTLVA